MISIQPDVRTKMRKHSSYSKFRRQKSVTSVLMRVYYHHSKFDKNQFWNHTLNYSFLACAKRKSGSKIIEGVRG